VGFQRAARSVNRFDRTCRSLRRWAARLAARELTVAQGISGFRAAQLPGLGVVALLQDQGPDPGQ
jgi:hypothetical protein